MGLLKSHDAGSAESADPGTRAPIALADLAPFRLGALEVHPSIRQVTSSGLSETVEPRVMQVLVALAEARGRVVSYDELIDRCWAGRVVGENAIHRIVSRLRDIAAGIGAGSFELKTINKVGYRLVVRGEAAGAAGEPHRRAPLSATRRKRLLAAAAVVAGLLSAAAVWMTYGAPDVPIVAVIAREGSRSEAAALDLSADLARLAGARADEIAVVEADRRSDADYLATIAVMPAGDRLRADIGLSDRHSQLLWSASVDRPAREAIGLRQELSSRLGQLLLCALGTPGARRLDRAGTRLFLAACDRGGEPPDDRQLDILRRLTEQAPGFAEAWAERAAVEAQLGHESVMTVSRSAASRRLHSAARLHIERARALDPDLGTIHAAESELLGRTRWAERIAVHERGLAAAPDHAALHALHSDVLETVGRSAEAVHHARRASLLNPLSPAYRSTLISRLAYAGEVEQARRELAIVEDIWPESEAVKDIRFRFHLRFGDPREALRMVESGEIAEIPDPARLFLRARADPSTANLAAALDAGRRQVSRYPSGAIPHLQTLAHFGQVDEAFRLLQQPEAIAGLRYGPEILFRPQMRSLRVDRRFMAVTARLGLLQYWHSSGSWPDFCGDTQLSYDCPAEAARLLR